MSPALQEIYRQVMEAKANEGHVSKEAMERLAQRHATEVKTLRRRIDRALKRFDRASSPEKRWEALNELFDIRRELEARSDLAELIRVETES